MNKSSLTALAHTQLEAARSASNGRSAHTVYGGHEHTLRQTMVALAAGQGLAEHDSPGEATIQVLHGRIQLISGDVTWDGAAGDHLVIPPARHSVAAVEDSVFLLTVVAGRPAE